MLTIIHRSGPGNPIAAATGFPWVKAVTDLFAVGPGKTTTNGTFVPPPLLMSFTVRTYATATRSLYLQSSVLAISAPFSLNIPYTLTLLFTNFTLIHSTHSVA